MKNTVLLGTLVACFIIASWFFSPGAMAMARHLARAGVDMSHTRLRFPREPAIGPEVAIAASAAAAISVLDSVVMGFPQDNRDARQSGAAAI